VPTKHNLAFRKQSYLCRSSSRNPNCIFSSGIVFYGLVVKSSESQEAWSAETGEDARGELEETGTCNGSMDKLASFITVFGRRVTFFTQAWTTRSLLFPKFQAILAASILVSSYRTTRWVVDPTESLVPLELRELDMTRYLYRSTLFIPTNL